MVAQMYTIQYKKNRFFCMLRRGGAVLWKKMFYEKKNCVMRKKKVGRRPKKKNPYKRSEQDFFSILQYRKSIFPL